MPNLIGRCGGGSSIFVYRGVGAYTGDTIPSGTPTALILNNFQDNDPDHNAFDFQSVPTEQLVLVSQAYIYVVTLVANWSAFAGDRTVTLSLDPLQTYFALPLPLTTPDSVQTVTSVVWLDSTAPANIAASVTQSSGSPRVLDSALIYAQATQLNN